MGKILSMIGKKYGRLLCVAATNERYQRATVWVFKCECGNEIKRVGSTVRNGNTKSCGCLQRDTVREVGKAGATHGQSRGGILTPEYRTWRGIWERAKGKQDFNNYKGRGITVCDRWKSFDNFLLDMGKRPSGGKWKWSIDRIDNDGNYEPGNCRWTTAEVQANNRRKRRESSELEVLLASIRREKHDMNTAFDRSYPLREGVYVSITNRDGRSNKGIVRPIKYVVISKSKGPITKPQYLFKAGAIGIDQAVAIIAANRQTSTIRTNEHD